VRRPRLPIRARGHSAGPSGPRGHPAARSGSGPRLVRAADAVAEQRDDLDRTAPRRRDVRAAVGSALASNPRGRRTRSDATHSEWNGLAHAWVSVATAIANSAAASPLRGGATALTRRAGRATGHHRELGSLRRGARHDLAERRPTRPGNAHRGPAATTTPQGRTVNPRIRRLTADYEALNTAFAGHPYVRVEVAGGAPPDRYRVHYRVWGLHRTPTNELQRVSLHQVDVQLPGGYPREKPYCTTAAPIFHPNFGAYVCIADLWTADRSLVDVLVQIGDMIQFKVFNTGSPLNAVAARWASENLDLVPVGTADLYAADTPVTLTGSELS
jgi:ubiquitin-protein ligase